MLTYFYALANRNNNNNQGRLFKWFQYYIDCLIFTDLREAFLGLNILKSLVC